MGLGVDLDMRRYIVNMEMRRYIVLLLITGIVWAQTDFDKLILKDGTTFFGEYSKIEGEIVYFKPQDTFAFQQVPVKQIKNLQLKDSRFIIGKYKRELTTKSTGVNKLPRNEKVVVGCLLIAVVIYFTLEGMDFSFNRPGLSCGLPCGEGTVDLP